MIVLRDLARVLAPRSVDIRKMVTPQGGTFAGRCLFRHADGSALSANMRCDHGRHFEILIASDSISLLIFLSYSKFINRMHTLRSILLGVSSVSAIILSPDSVLISGITTSPTKPNNVSTTSDAVQGSWHSSNVLEVPPMSTNKTDSSTSMMNREVEWRCNDLLGHGPYAASCEDAARHMAFIPPDSDDSQELLWGRRDWPLVRDVPLPQEVVSCKRLTRTQSIVSTF